MLIALSFRQILGFENAKPVLDSSIAFAGNMNLMAETPQSLQALIDDSRACLL